MIEREGEGEVPHAQLGLYHSLDREEDQYE